MGREMGWRRMRRGRRWMWRGRGVERGMARWRRRRRMWKGRRMKTRGSWRRGTTGRRSRGRGRRRRLAVRT